MNTRTKHQNFITYLYAFTGGTQTTESADVSTPRKENRQALAVLRRSLSHGPGLDLAVFRYIGRFLGDASTPKTERLYALIAGLYTLAPCQPMSSSKTLGRTH